MAEAANTGQLKRAIGPVQLMLYGIGSMLGAGIYGLVGKAAAQLGGMVWAGFLVAMVAALLTGVSYASIASRYPKAAGAAYAAHRAYKNALVSFVIGLAVVCSGLSSMAAGSRVVAENVWKLIDPETVAAAPTISLLAVGYLLVVAAVVFRGIRESLWFNAVCTFIEAGGLILVIIVGVRFWGRTNLMELPEAADPTTAATTLLVLQGAVLTFFSFIGFEDMLNVAEEVKQPRRTMPIAMIGAMIFTSIIYMSVAITAVSVLPWRELAAAPGPLTAVMEVAAPWFPAIGFTILTIFAVANTALVNYVMGSRLLYGLGSQGIAPQILSRVHKTRGTPHISILVLLAVVIGLSFLGDISQLASATVLLLLFVFAVVNIGLIILLRREGRIEGAFNVPMVVPALGALICIVLIVVRIAQNDLVAPMIAGGLLLGITALYFATGKGRAERIARFVESDI
jgi:basic amino acid/polyamine antiporter, APA family